MERRFVAYTVLEEDDGGLRGDDGREEVCEGGFGV